MALNSRVRKYEYLQAVDKDTLLHEFSWTKFWIYIVGWIVRCIERNSERRVWLVCPFDSTTFHWLNANWQRFVWMPFFLLHAVVLDISYSHCILCCRRQHGKYTNPSRHPPSIYPFHNSCGCTQAKYRVFISIIWNVPMFELRIFKCSDLFE